MCSPHLREEEESAVWVARSGGTALTVDGCWDFFSRHLFGKRVFFFALPEGAAPGAPAVAALPGRPDQRGLYRGVLIAGGLGRFESLVLPRERVALYGGGDDEEPLRRTLCGTVFRNWFAVGLVVSRFFRGAARAGEPAVGGQEDEGGDVAGAGAKGEKRVGEKKLRF